MNKNIDQLYRIANKKERLIIGLMSGTSVDGLDVALCNFKGNGAETEIEILFFETVAFDDDFKKEIKSVFSKRNVDLEKVCLLNAWIADRHAAIINDCLKKWNIKNGDVDLIASHGQTIYHAPKILHGIDKFPNATLQIGDGDHLAVKTGIITVSDFRQKHVAAGGEGAPLAVYGDYFIFSKKAENRVMLNIGGIANFTYLPGNLNVDEVFSTDVGAGNTLMDAYVQKYFEGKYFDEDASIAKQGIVNENLLQALKDNGFFKNDFPKTTGPELFNLNFVDEAKEKSNTQNISNADTMATLNRFTADGIVDALKRSLTAKDFIVYTSGGGMHNDLLMQNIQQQLPNILFKNFSELKINPDAKEALLFAVLANECVCGGEIKLGKEKKGIPNVTMGKISFPW
ncbi:anhydro-N-acetylmuramic acid kinase [mine drainage metagenome]|uniref:Anhydro-N-acetylmuramic acid kinase n=1 Tax=mine drainage metagenome TaxID=410659 RepID=A0A1J5TM99_9ZZZZ